ncbi:gamma-glutamyltransferase family protein [Celeribacter persicus]|uniref:Gamma-glutamyltransferase 2 n=1 Tax=Celeribacter persicus TaxID=1651082 RepID=A0A2T5HUM8_9RHOB|nr:gamma-glutamyltransferase family protein [Celeribacter persicus]PTQ75297.1 gamma-glutamyltransferase 2 [Celeribacter persicus]
MLGLKSDPWFENGQKKAVLASDAMIVAPSPQATLAGYDMLRAGGSAMDAAIAAMGVTSVVEASQAGPGGDCFALIFDPKSGLHAYNGSGRPPMALTADALRAEGHQVVPRVSPHSVTVPGAIEAWCRLHRDFGRKDLADVLAAGIHYAEDGFVLHPRVVRDWHESRDLLIARPETARHFLKNGQPPQIGDRWALPGYGAVLRSVAHQGPDAFYQGAFAERLVGFLRDLGGAHTLADFAGHQGEYVPPASVDAYGQSFYECPPNGQGLSALALIRMVETALSDTTLNSLDGHHLLSEASKIAFALRDDLIAQPEAMTRSVDDILSDAALARMLNHVSSDTVRPRRPATDYLPEHKDTSYVTVVDRDGMAVSLISSVFTDFGSTLVEPESGIILQNRGAGFSLIPGHPNELAPGKRPLHTIIPGMALKDGKPSLSFGVTGGDYQPVGHAVLAQGIFAEGLDPQEALNMPRSHCMKDQISVEEVLAPEIRTGLAEKGHNLALSTHPIGGGHAIFVDQTRGVLVGGTDSRRDGIVAGY